MQDTALYQYLLGLKSPWTVSRVQLNVTGQCVDVWAEHPEDAVWACPHCTKTLPLYDHAEARTWRHLDSGQFQTTCTRGSHGWPAGNTEWSRLRCHGRSRGRDLRCSSSASPSMCWGSAT